MKRKVPKTLKVVAGVAGAVVAVWVIAVAVLTLISPRLIPIDEDDDDFFGYEDDELEDDI